MVGVIEGFRWALFESSFEAFNYHIYYSVAIIILMFLIGLFYFKKVEETMADII